MKFNVDINKADRSFIPFVHSLFRSGSTYFYSAIKRTGMYYPYHEPFHEIVGSLSTSWSDISIRSDKIKLDLRHEFMESGYFDEYFRLLPFIKKSFAERFSYEYYFLGRGAEAEDLRTYIDALIKAAPRTPVLQCTRTIGRVQWLKSNFDSKHIFLLRNPWDQWYSYKVDKYISSTPRIIASQPNVPPVFTDVMAFRNVRPLEGAGLHEKLAYAHTHPISPEADYALFFVSWVHSFIMSKRHGDLAVDMDSICEDTAYRAGTIEKLGSLGLNGIDLSDAALPRAVFEPRERSFYEMIEDQVLEVFHGHDYEDDEILDVQNYLVSRRAETFSGANFTKASKSSILNDAARLRDALINGDRHNSAIATGLVDAIKTRDIDMAAVALRADQKQQEIDELVTQVESWESNHKRCLADLQVSADLCDAKAADLAFAQSEILRLRCIEEAAASQSNELAEEREASARLQSDYQRLASEWDVAKAKHDADLQELLVLRDEAVEKCNSLVVERNQAAAAYEASLNELACLRDDALAQRDGAAAIYEANLREVSRLRDEAIAQRNSVIAERDGVAIKYRESLNELSALRDETAAARKSMAADRDALSVEIVQLRDQQAQYQGRLEQSEANLSQAEHSLARSSQEASQEGRSRKLVQYDLAAAKQILENYQNRFTSEIERNIRRGSSISRKLLRLTSLVKPDRFQRMDDDARTIDAFLDQFSDSQLQMSRDGRRHRILCYLAGLTSIVDDFPIFNRDTYLSLYPDVARAKIDAFVHFIKFGRREGRTIHPIIDRVYYLTQYPEVEVLEMSVVEHFIRFGADKGYNPCALFDVKWYFEQYPDVRVSGCNPVLHFLRHPRCAPHPLFDANYYLWIYSDVEASNVNPLIHYLTYGSLEDRNPNPWFDSKFYMRHNSDLPSDLNPLSHYVTAGHREGRRPNPHFDPKQYTADAGDLGGRSALEHYVHVGRFAADAPRASVPAPDNTSPGLPIAPSLAITRTSDKPRIALSSSSSLVATRRKVAVMVNAFYPHPDEDAGSLEQISFARIFQSLGYEVAYVGLLDFATKDKYRDSLEAMGVHCISSDNYNNLEEYLFLNAEFLEVAFLSRVHWGGAWIDRVRLFCPTAKIIFNTVDLHYVREERQAALTGDAAGLVESQKTKEAEFRCVRAADVTIVLSTTELDILTEEIPGAMVTIVPIMREIGEYDFRGFSKRNDIAFIGGFQHQPNIDAVEYFLDEIWPLVLNDLPDMRTRIIGSHLPESLSSRQDQNVDWVGYVPDIDTELDSLRLTVAPLRYGAGAKGKVVSSLARGVPCVASVIAAEGMGLEDGENIAVGKTSADFARAIVRLYTDPEAWNRLSREGFSLIQRDYSLDTGARLVSEILAQYEWAGTSSVHS